MPGVRLAYRDVRQLERVSAALKVHANGKMLRSDMRKGITKAVKPLKKNAKQNARQILPSSGGLNRRVARTTLQHRVRGSGGARVGVHVRAKPSHKTLRDPLRVDRGMVRHPVFGQAVSRADWQLQKVPPGWFRTPMKKGGPVIRQELVDVMQGIAKQIARSS